MPLWGGDYTPQASSDKVIGSLGMFWFCPTLLLRFLFFIPGFFSPTPLVHSVPLHHGSIVQLAGLLKILCRRWVWWGWVGWCLSWKGYQANLFEIWVWSEVWHLPISCWFEDRDFSVYPPHCLGILKCWGNKWNSWLPTGSRLWLWTTKTWSSPVAQGLTFWELFFWVGSHKWSEALKADKVI